MNGFFIASYVLFGIISIIGIVYLYTMFLYTKHTLFTKTKYNPLTYCFSGLIFAILLVAGILFLTTLKNSFENENTLLHAGLCFGFLGIDVVFAVLYTLIIYFNNKHKIDYKDIPNTNFKQLLKQQKDKIGDIEALKTKIQKHHKAYYKSMISRYFELLNRAKEKNISKADKIADIVMFNDTFAHKWCILTNNYQIYLTYEFLSLI